MTRPDAAEVSTEPAPFHDAGLRIAGWDELPAMPVQTRADPVVVATDRGIVVWSGAGAVYDAAADSWTTMSPSPLSPRSHALSVWTGTEVVVVGGTDEAGDPLGDAAAYDPTTDRWRALPRVGGSLTVQRPYAAATWTGTDVVVTGIEHPADLPIDLVSDTFALDPGGDEWRPVAPVDLGPGHVAARYLFWTGDRALLVAVPSSGSVQIATVDPDAPLGCCRDVLVDTSLQVPETAAMVGVPLVDAVWTGSLLVLLTDGQTVTYDPAHGAVSSLPGVGPAPPRRVAAAVDESTVAIGRGTWLDLATGRWRTRPPDLQQQPSPNGPAVAFDGRYYFVPDPFVCPENAQCTSPGPRRPSVWTPRNDASVRDCGSYSYEPVNVDVDEAKQRCLVEAFDAGEPAVLLTEAGSIDSTVVTRYVVLGTGSIEIRRTGTGMAIAPVSTTRCTSLTVVLRQLRPEGCTP